ncbi:MAG TPA: VOC family protein [Aestuariivirga sp.]|nr:VOC family protein [Alphaproteobacteria bacterium]HRX36821.1 VOC family protein [Aestuariivirga sp.]
MTPRINLVTLGITDMERSRSFYEHLGFAASKTSNPDVTFFDANGIVLGLFGHDALADDAHVPRGNATEFRGVSLAWNAESEAAVDAIMDHAKSIGARIVKPPQKVFWGGYSGYFADPDGHLWEVAYNPFFPLDAEGRIRLP